MIDKRNQPGSNRDLDRAKDQRHAPAPDSPDRDDGNLNSARRHGDPIPEDADITEPGLTPQPKQPKR